MIESKAMKRYKARRNRALRKAEGKLMESSADGLEKLLPFKPIANDKDYDKKLLIAHFIVLFPHIADLDYCFRLFRKHFSVSLTDFDDEAMVAEFIAPYLLEHFHALRPKPFVRKNLALLQECFGLNELETKILYLIGLCDNISRYYDCDDRLNYFEFCLLVAQVLKVTPRKVQKLLMANMPLRKFGFIDDRHRSGEFDLGDFAQKLMQEPFSKQEMVKSLARIYPKSTLEIADFSYIQKDFGLYAKHLGIGDYAAFLESTFGKRELEKLDNICFGDFALIARGAAFAPLDSAEQLLEKLQEEAQLKGLSAGSKRVGF